MRPAILLLIIAAHASAQSDAGKLILRGLQGALTGLEPVPAQEQAAVLKATEELLAKHVTFRPDGTASAFCTSSSGRRQAEWKQFVVHSITAQPITEADRLNGVTKRYLASLSCDAHRTWDTAKNAWGQWYPIGNVIFPSGIYVEWKGGKWVAAESDMIKYFTPGPGAAVIDPKPAAAKSDGLPPGMTRGH